MLNSLHEGILWILHFQCIYKNNECSNKLYYFSTQQRLISVNFDGLFYASDLIDILVNEIIIADVTVTVRLISTFFRV
jgi:hypothetical protein